MGEVTLKVTEGYMLCCPLCGAFELESSVRYPEVRTFGENWVTCSKCRTTYKRVWQAARSSFAPEQQINTVTVRAEQNPRKTRQEVFLEQYPNARLDSEGIICICPEEVYGDEVKTLCVKSKLCYDCRHKFWPQEVKE